MWVGVEWLVVGTSGRGGGGGGTSHASPRDGCCCIARERWEMPPSHIIVHADQPVHSASMHVFHLHGTASLARFARWTEGSVVCTVRVCAIARQAAVAADGGRPEQLGTASNYSGTQGALDYYSAQSAAPSDGRSRRRAQRCARGCRAARRQRARRRLERRYARRRARADLAHARSAARAARHRLAPNGLEAR